MRIYFVLKTIVLSTDFVVLSFPSHYIYIRARVRLGQMDDYLFNGTRLERVSTNMLLKLDEIVSLNGLNIYFPRFKRRVAANGICFSEVLTESLRSGLTRTLSPTFHTETTYSA